MPIFKNLLLVLMLPALISGNYELQQFNPVSTVGPGDQELIRVSDTLAVKMADEKGLYTWVLAQAQCASYGKDWHVPNILELKMLYLIKDSIGQFNGEWYWSSSEYYNEFGRAHNFVNGDRNDPYEDKERPYSVRCVKTVVK